MFLFSVKTRSNFSPARNVLSTTDPESIDFIFVRTNAPPLPGFTCWNSTMRQVWPSSSMCMPLRNSFVETGGTRVRLANQREFLGEVREHLHPVLTHDGQILDPHTADTRQVHTGLDRDDVSGLERVLRFLRQSRRFVDRDADAVPEPVTEVLAEARSADDVARDLVGIVAGHPRLDLLRGGDLCLEADVVRTAQLLRQPVAGRHRARAIG